MRKHAVTAALALTLVTGLATAPGWVASADEGDGSHPSRAEVRDARQAADDKAGEVAAVQARLAEAQGRLQDSAVRVAQAEEAFNRARWLYREARRKQRGAERAETTSETQLGAMRDQYADLVVASYQMSPSLNAMSAILDADGIAEVVESTTSLHNAQTAMDQVYDDYDVAALLAGVATDQATEARTAADELRDQTKLARQTARETQRAAAGEADAVAAERVELIGELARLQGISVTLAAGAAGVARGPGHAHPDAHPDADAHPTAPTRRRNPPRSRPRQATPPPTAAPTPTPTATKTPTATADADPDADADADPDAHPDAHSHADSHPDADRDPHHAAAGTRGRRRGRDRLRRGADRRALPVGRGRSGQVGLLRPDHAGLAGGRHLAAALLGRPVRRQHAHLRSRPAAR